jgi:hypothetical protein
MSGVGIGRRLPIIAFVLAFAVALIPVVPAMASGGGSSPSAGDNQYIDPLATPPRTHKRSTHRRSTTQAASAPVSSPTPSSAPQSSGGAASLPAPAATAPPSSAPPANPPHAVSVRRAHRTTARPRTATVVARRIHARPVSLSAAPTDAVGTPSRPGSSFPYLYVVIAAVGAAALALAARRVVLHRALHRA